MRRQLTFMLFFMSCTTFAATHLDNVRIGIDPGHGGGETGAVGSITNEKVHCLKMGKELKRRLEVDNATVHITRQNENDNPSISARASALIAANVVLTYSIHLNSYTTNNVYGPETYYCTVSGDGNRNQQLATNVFNKMVSCFRDGALGCATMNHGSWSRGAKAGCGTVALTMPASIPTTHTEAIFLTTPGEEGFIVGEVGFDSWVTSHQWALYDFLGKYSSGNVPSPRVRYSAAIPAGNDNFWELAYIDDNRKTTQVQFPTWTTNNGQDDLTWHAAEKGSWTVNGQNYNYRYRQKISEHNNERGTYAVHIYPWDAAGRRDSYSGTNYTFTDNAIVNFDVVQENKWNIDTNFGTNGGSGTWSYETSDGHFISNFNSKTAARPWQNSVGGSANNKQVTWSFWAKVSSGSYTFGSCGLENGLTKNVTVTNEWKRFSHSGTTQNTGYDALVFNGGDLPSGVTLSVKDYSVKVLGGVITEENNVCSVVAKRGQAMPAIVPPTRVGYKFMGYYTGANGTGTKYYNSDGTSAKNSDLTAQTTLYSHWLPAIAELVGEEEPQRYHFSLQEAINSTTESKKTVKLLEHTTENVVVDKQIIFQNPENKTITGAMTIEPTGELSVETTTNLTVSDSFVVQANSQNSAKINGRMSVEGRIVYQKMVDMTAAVPSESDCNHWISLPFAVNVCDITGSPLLDASNNEHPFAENYGKAWRIVEYNSVERGNANLAEDGRFWDALDYETGVMEPKKGYVLQFVRMPLGNLTISFPAANNSTNLNTTDTEGKTVSETNGNSAHKNWWLVGQPYFCNTFVSNGPRYVVKMVGGSDHYNYFLWWESEILKPYESFFVQYNNKISFADPNVAGGLSPLQKSDAEDEYIMVNLANESISRRIGVILSDNGTNSYDEGRDLAPLGSDKTLNFYSINGQKLVFNDIKKENQTVRIGYNTNTAGTFKISLSDVEMFAGDTHVKLEDRQNGTRTNLRLGNYEFTTQKGTYDNRFLLHINKSATEIQNIKSDLIISQFGGTIWVENVENSHKITLFDSLGRHICTQKTENGRAEFNRLQSGVYLLQTDNQTVKIVVL